MQSQSEKPKKTMLPKRHIFVLLLAASFGWLAHQEVKSRQEFFEDRFFYTNSSSRNASNNVDPLSVGADTLYRSLFEASISNSGIPLDNFVISPVSLYNVLAMVAMGARGSTLEEIELATNIRTDEPAWQEKQTAFLNNFEMPAEGNGTGKRMINDILVAREFPVWSDYLDKLTSVFRARATSADFCHDHEAVRREFNERISNFTQGLIKEALPDGAIKNITKIVVSNAVLFKDKWLHGFKDEESMEPFFVRRNSSVPMPMMRLTGEFKVADLGDLGAKALLLPFKDKRHGLLVVLPNEVDGLTKLERQLLASSFAPSNILKAMHPCVVSVTLPKFSINYKMKLNDVLKKIGIGKLFTRTSDLSGISPEMDCAKNKSIDIFHESAMEVDRDGAIAAAATEASMTVYVSSHPMRFIFAATRPFLFYLMDLENDSVPLFVGHVADPRRDA